MIRGAVLGQDVSKSRSPDIHRAAFAALGVDGDYEAISLPALGFTARVRALGRHGYTYLNVTIPHKRWAARLADTQSPAVAMTGAANTLVFRQTRSGLRVHADNTDGEGLLAAMGDLGVKPGPRSRVVMVGAGGAAAGALLALLRTGSTVAVLARRTSAAAGLVRRLPARWALRTRVLPLHARELASALAGATILISAVPAAAWTSGEASAGLRGLNAETAVIEMAYGAPSALAAAAKKQACRYQDGLPMLVHQAARAIEVALGQRPPVAPLFRAVAGQRGRDR